MKRLVVLIPIAAALAACSVVIPQKTTATSTSSPGVSASVATPVQVNVPSSNGSIASAVDLQSAYVTVIHAVLPAVVQIETDRGLGSGVVFDAQGDIVTNNHVIDGATSVKVTTSDGQSFTADVLGTYAPDDLAVIRPAGAQKLTYATFGDSTKLEVGDIVLAIGNPLGLQSSVTSGIVSAVGRTESEDNGVVLPDTIQTSAEINPGNSGGALVDLNGQVVGIPTLAVSGASGIGFAIPSAIVKDISGQIVTDGKVVNSHRAYIGVRGSYSGYDNGYIISAIVGGSPAEKAGLLAGELIVSVDGQAINTADSLSVILAGESPGKSVPVQVVQQDGTRKTVDVTLGQYPS